MNPQRPAHRDSNPRPMTWETSVFPICYCPMCCVPAVLTTKSLPPLGPSGCCCGLHLVQTFKTRIDRGGRSPAACPPPSPPNVARRGSHACFRYAPPLLFDTVRRAVYRPFKPPGHPPPPPPPPAGPSGFCCGLHLVQTFKAQIDRDGRSPAACPPPSPPNVAWEPRVFLVCSSPVVSPCSRGATGAPPSQDSTPPAASSCSC